jgi:hypothetical protein
MRAYRGRPSRGAGQGNSSNSVSHVAPSVNSATNSALLVCGWLGGALGNYTLPGGMTAGPAETDSFATTMRTAYQAIAASGATGTRTATHSVSCKATAVSVVVHGSGLTVQQTLSGTSETDDVTLTTSGSTQAGWWLLALHGWSRDTVANMPTAPNDSEGGWIPVADSGRIANADGSLHVRAWVRRVNNAGAQSVKFFGRRPEEPQSNNHAHLYVLSGVDSFSARFSQFAARFDPTYTPKVGGAYEVSQTITCGGILRRLDMGTSPARSPIAREVLSVPNSPFIVGYWPCEDGATATRFASAIAGGPAAVINGAVTVASYGGFAGSQPIPVLAAGGSISGTVPVMADGSFSWRHIMTMPGSGVANNQTLIDIFTTGTGKRWQVLYTTGGNLNLRVLDAAGTVLAQIGGIDFSAFIHNLRFLLAVDAVQNGANVDVTLTVRRVNADGTSGGADVGFSAGTFNAVTIGHPETWIIGASGALTSCAVGHAMIGTSSTFAFGMASALIAYAGERAGRRAARLCAEERIPFHPIGDLDLTQEMGPQQTAKFQQLLLDCQDADRGILGETRQDFGLFYLALSGLYNRSAGLTVNLATYNTESKNVDQVFRPVYDDQDLRNDIEVSRTDGSSARAQDLTSQAQGIFDTSADLRLFADDQLTNIAMWMLRQGTVKDYRHPALPLDLGANTGLIAAWLGYTETIRPREWLITAFGAPWTFDAGVYGTATVVSRYDSENSRLTGGPYAAGVTTLSVETDAGHALWVTGSGGPTFPFDVNIAGLRVTVTAISGAASPQSFTVTRNVDGIDKTLNTGDQVRLWAPARYGL